jgi:hypothetical protein
MMIDVVVDLRIVDGPFAIPQQEFYLLLSSFEVVVPVLTKLLTVLEPI